MKRILTILLLFIISATYVAGRECTPIQSQAAGKGKSSLCNTEKKNIEKLSNELQECCFEVPATGSIQFTYKNKQQPARRFCGSCKTVLAANLQTQQQKIAVKGYSIHSKITESRHSRGYYIYTLRHIII